MDGEKNLSKVGASFYPESTLQDLERLLKCRVLIDMMLFYYPLYVFAVFYEWAFKVD